ncbi:hypothetical protein Tco_0723285 [Tanacetum coccineum]
MSSQQGSQTGEEVKYGEFGHLAPFNGSNGAKFHVGPPGYNTRTDNQTPSGEKKTKLENSRIDHDKIIPKLESQVKTLTTEVETKVAKLEGCKTIFANDGAPMYTPFYYSPKEIEYFSANSGFSDNKKSESTELKFSKVIPNLPEQTVNHYVKPYVLPIPFPNRLKQHAEEALVHETMESLKKIKINRPLLKEIRQMDNHPKYMNDLVANKCSLIAQEANGGIRSNLTSTKKKLHWGTPISCTKKGVQEISASCSPFEGKCDGGSLCHNEIKCYWESENDGKRINVEWEDLILNDWLRIRFGEVSETARGKILTNHWIKRFRNDYDDSEDFEDPDGCREGKENEILGTIINKLHDEWFKGMHEDDDDLEGIIDYLEPTLYDGFIDSDDEGVMKHIIMGENIDWLNKSDLGVSCTNDECNKRVFNTGGRQVSVTSQ